MEITQKAASLAQGARRIAIAAALPLLAFVLFALYTAVPALPAPDPVSTALARAVDREDEDLKSVTDVLTRGADPDTEVSGRTPLVAATIRGHLQVMTALLDAGADVDGWSGDGTPLDYAVAQGKPEPVKLLLDAGADARAASVKGMGALAYCALHGNAPVSKLLLDAGAPVEGFPREALSPLMIAAREGRAEVAGALLQGGASRDDRFPTSSGAAEIARRAGHEDLAKLIEDFGGELPPAAPDEAGALHPAPGDDLLAATSQAKDGALIILGPGAYKGPLAVSGKSLWIRGDPEKPTTIAGNDQPLVAQVDNGGKLFMQDVTVEIGGKTQLGVAIRGGLAFLTRCRFAAGPSYAVYAEGGEVHLLGCELSGLQDTAAVGLNGSSITVRGSTFNDLKKGALVVQGNGTLDVAGSDFSAITNGVAVALQGSSLTVRDSTISTCQGATVDLEQGKALTVAGARIEGCDRGIAVSGGEPAVAIRGNTISGATPDSFGLMVSSNGTTLIADNAVANVGAGMRIDGQVAAPVVVARNTFLNLSKAGLAVQARRADGGTSVRLSHNRILNAAGFGIMLNGGARGVLAANTVLSTDGIAVGALEQSNVSLHGDVLLGGQAALTRDESPNADTRLFRLLALSAIALPGPGVSRDRDTQRLTQVVALTTAGSRLTSAARQALAAAPKTDPAQVDRLLAPLDAAVGAARERAATLATLTVGLADSLGTTAPEDFAVYRANDVDPAHAVAQVGSAGFEEAYLPAGRYWVEPKADPFRGRMVALSARQNLRVTSTADNSVWFLLYQGGNLPHLRFLAHLKSPAQMQRSLQQFRGTTVLGDVVAFPRPGVPADQVAAALELARKTLPDIPLDPDRLTDLTWQQRRQRVAAFEYAARILALAGDASDAKRLMQVPADASNEVKWRHVSAAAYLEARLGALDRGEVAAALSSPDKDLALIAAICLHYYGLAAGDGLLLNALRDPTAPANFDAAAFALLDTPDDAVLKAMREAVDRYRAARAAASPAPKEDEVAYRLIPERLYLLAYGTREDWARVGSLPLGAYNLTSLAYLVADPSTVAETMPTGPSLSSQMARLNLPLRDLPANQAQYWGEFFGALVRGITGHESDVLHYQLDRSFTQPSGVTARQFFLGIELAEGTKLGDVLWESPWMPMPWGAKEFVGELAGGDDRNAQQLDAVSDDELVKLLGEAGAKDKVYGLDLLLAYHRIGTRTGYAGADEYPGGVERRPYSFRQTQGYAGALTGVAAVKPELSGKKLRLSLQLSQAPYYHKGDLISAHEENSAWPFYKYSQDWGKSLIGAVRLRRGNTVLPATAVNSPQVDIFAYEADLDKPDLSNLYLDVDLQFLDQKQTFTYDLFAGDLARSQRRAAGHGG